MSLPKIIAIAAPAAQSGKTTAANVMMRYFGYEKFSFAMPIKTMFIALCMTCDMPKALYPEILDGKLKEKPLALLGGLSLRSFAEGVGTTWGRNMVNKNLWVNIARPKIRTLLDEGKMLVIDDVRFENEADLVRDLGGDVLYVERPVSNGGREPSQVSEGQLSNYAFDCRFKNDGTLEEYESQIHTYMNERKAE